MNEPLVTILVPHYKTLELTKLCLRLLRKYTSQNQARIVVIDNDSQDDSLPYLRNLRWITLIERKSIPNEGGVAAHSRALDLALEQVTTPYVLSIHTDTLVKRSDWLDFLLQQIKSDSNIAGVGSWKLEQKSLWRRICKQTERYAQLTLYKFSGKTQHSLEGIGKNYYYLRSHCALYDMSLLRKYNLHFSDGDKVAGKEMHKTLMEKGHAMNFLSSEQLIKYLEHINHATTVLNPELSRQRSQDKGLRRIEKSLARMNANTILNDASLDS